MVNNSKTAIVIAGPTAVGKTAVAIALAKYLNTEIISADSRQCYKELKIGVARPSVAELSMVPHHFIATHSIHEKITAATFENYALKKAAEIFVAKDYVVITGGTGLYIDAFCKGFHPIPDVPERVRAGILNSYQQQGITWLQQALTAADPLYSRQGEMKNPQRMMRALEVIRATGKSILDYRTSSTTERDFNIIKIALELPKELLHQNINERVDNMIVAGLLEEVRSLQPYKHLNALQTVGYKELFLHLEGGLSLEEAIAEIKKNTRQYAKRQLTWFKRDKEYTWLHADAQTVINYLSSLMDLQ